MRTTLTLDSDVAALLTRLLKAQKASLKKLVNQALRMGLLQLGAPQQPRPRFVTRTVSLGRCLVASIDDVEEVLATTEGDNHK